MLARNRLKPVSVRHGQLEESGNDELRLKTDSLEDESTFLKSSVIENSIFDPFSSLSGLMPGLRGRLDRLDDDDMADFCRGGLMVKRRSTVGGVKQDVLKKIGHFISLFLFGRPYSSGQSVNHIFSSGLMKKFQNRIDYSILK